jgi:hypothetical protein
MSLAGILKEGYNGEGGPFEPYNSYRNPLNDNSYFFASNRCKENLTYTGCDTSTSYTSKLYLMSASMNVGNDKNTLWIYCGHYAAFTPKQQKYLDDKLDDGKPKTGKLVASQMGYSQVGCHNSTIVSGSCLLNNTDNAYNVANDEYACQMHYRLDL